MARENDIARCTKEVMNARFLYSLMLVSEYILVVFAAAGTVLSIMHYEFQSKP